MLSHQSLFPGNCSNWNDWKLYTAFSCLGIKIVTLNASGEKLSHWKVSGKKLSHWVASGKKTVTLNGIRNKSSDWSWKKTNVTLTGISTKVLTKRYQEKSCHTEQYQDRSSHTERNHTGQHQYKSSHTERYQDKSCHTERYRENQFHTEVGKGKRAATAKICK